MKCAAVSNLRRSKVFFGLVMLFILPIGASAQFKDSIQASMTKKPKIIFKFDTRKSFIDNSNVTVFGWKLGVEFDKRIRIGGGFNNLTANHSENLDRVYFEENGIDTLGIGILNFGYFCYFVEYVIIHKPKWEISYPIQFGLGSSHYRLYSETSGKVEMEKGSVLLLETAIAGHYKLTKWFGIGMGLGYRLMLRNNQGLDSKFNSPIYVFKLKIFLSGIINSFSKKKPEELDETEED